MERSGDNGSKSDSDSESESDSDSESGSDSDSDSDSDNGKAARLDVDERSPNSCSSRFDERQIVL